MLAVFSAQAQAKAQDNHFEVPVSQASTGSFWSRYKVANLTGRGAVVGGAIAAALIATGVGAAAIALRIIAKFALAVGLGAGLVTPDLRQSAREPALGNDDLQQPRLLDQQPEERPSNSVSASLASSGSSEIAGISQHRYRYKDVLPKDSPQSFIGPAPEGCAGFKFMGNFPTEEELRKQEARDALEATIAAKEAETALARKQGKPEKLQHAKVETYIEPKEKKPTTPANGEISASPRAPRARPVLPVVEAHSRMENYKLLRHDSCNTKRNQEFNKNLDIREDYWIFPT